MSLAWTITAPNGKVLGTISQSNMVPVGSIDLGWGDTAIQVAEAAALGIFDLVKKLALNCPAQRVCHAPDALI